MSNILIPKALADEIAEERSELHADDYIGTLGIDFKPFKRASFLNIEVLEFLKGREWNDIALAYVHALRPSKVRVTTGWIKLNACNWRVTVYTSPCGKFIRKIEQEVCVGLPKGVEHGHDLSQRLKN